MLHCVLAVDFDVVFQKGSYMEVRNCRKCGRIFNYIGGSYRNLCPNCIDAMEDLFEQVKSFIDENPGASMPEVSNTCGVSSKQIEQWIREERLQIADNSPIGIGCEICGKMIKSGKFCPNCKDSMANTLNSAYHKPIMEKREEIKRRPGAAKMRFLDN